jgi:hypothetical protein
VDSQTLTSDTVTIRDLKRIGSAIAERAETSTIADAIDSAVSTLCIPRWIALYAWLFFRES